MSYIKQAYNWAETFKISFIKSAEILKTMCIRKLKAVALKMNRELGQIICKATFGKVMSAMCKQELINAIWFVRSVQIAAPKGKFELRQLTQRIFAMLCDGEAHVYYFGFNKDFNGTAEQNANKFQKHLAVKGLCTLSSVRIANRLKPYGFEYEVKVWGIDNNTLMKLLTKDNKPIAVSSVEAGDRFIVVDDQYGWIGSSGKVVDKKGNSILAEMDNVSGGKVTFDKKQVKNEEEVTIEDWVKICQKMYDNCKHSKAVNAMVSFIQRKGFEIVDGRVEVKF